MGFLEDNGIRRMRLEDAEEAAEIDRLSFALPWSAGSYAQETKNPVAWYYVLERDGLIAAMSGMWLILGEGQITTIAVRPEYRRQGLGRIMLRAMLTAAYEELNVTEMSLEVRPSNMPARNLYRSMGFVEEGRRRRYYEDNGEDAIIMWNHDTLPAINGELYPTAD